MSKVYLNVYGQDSPGDSVIIVGNRAGLEALRSALQKAKSSKRGSPKRGSSKVFASDGSEYELKIYSGDPEKTIGSAARAFWRLLAYPYHEKLGRVEFISPWEWD